VSAKVFSCNVNVVDLLQLMRKLRPLRGTGKDGDATKGSPRADVAPVTQLEWVEEEPSLHPNCKSCNIHESLDASYPNIG
jgi:hypothetical protein